jgi:hypothetical protein
MANSFKNAGIAVLDTRTPLYGPVPVDTAAVIHALYISNVGSAPANVDIEITVDGGTTYRYIGKGLSVPEDSTLVLDKPINLEAEDKLELTASAVGHIEAVCAVLEID